MFVMIEALGIIALMAVLAWIGFVLIDIARNGV
jgi:hypothetical protein